MDGGENARLKRDRGEEQEDEATNGATSTLAIGDAENADELAAANAVVASSIASMGVNNSINNSNHPGVHLRHLVHVRTPLIPPLGADGYAAAVARRFAEQHQYRHGQRQGQDVSHAYAYAGGEGNGGTGFPANVNTDAFSGDALPLGRDAVAVDLPQYELNTIQSSIAFVAQQIREMDAEKQWIKGKRDKGKTYGPQLGGIGLGAQRDRNGTSASTPSLAAASASWSSSAASPSWLAVAEQWAAHEKQQPFLSRRYIHPPKQFAHSPMLEPLIQMSEVANKVAKGNLPRAVLGKTLMSTQTLRSRTVGTEKDGEDAAAMSGHIKAGQILRLFKENRLDGTVSGSSSGTQVLATPSGSSSPPPPRFIALSPSSLAHPLKDVPLQHTLATTKSGSHGFPVYEMVRTKQPI